jgi:hypothetical protein
MRRRRSRRRIGLAWCGPGLFFSVASCGLTASGCGGESAVAGSGGAAAASGGGGGGAADRDGGAAGGGSPGQAGAAGVIVVDTPSGEVATESWDGHCDLLEAIAAANTDQAVRECPPGSGADRILLADGAVYPVTRTLTIDTEVTLGVVGGSGRATITAAPGFATQADDRGSGCLVHAKAAGATVKVEDVVLTQDEGLSLSGACLTSGWLELRRARVTGFARGGVAAYCLPELGCDHAVGDSSSLSVLSSLVDGNRSPAPGGGIFSEGNGTTLYVGSSAIVDNVSESSGGGVYFGGGWNTQKIATSTISGNRAASGGGVYVRFTACSATYLFITNSTIVHNTATKTGGGIDFDGQIDCHAQDVTVLSSIITNNVAVETAEDDIDADWNGGMFQCQLDSLIHVAAGLPLPQQGGDTPCRYDVSDALLGPLMPMGGAANLPLHALLHGSPAIDAAPDDLADDQQRDPWVAISDERPPPPDWRMFERVVDGDGDGLAVRDLGAFEANDVWQTELLQVRAKGPGSHALVTLPDGYARGAGTSYTATSASGEFVTYVVPIAEAGSYQVSVGLRRADDAGQLQVAIADDPAGPWLELDAAHDTYAPSSEIDEIPLARLDVPAPGQKFVRFAVSGKHPESRGFHLYLDFIRVKRSE